jgi:hypothetical protein
LKATCDSARIVVTIPDWTVRWLNIWPPTPSQLSSVTAGLPTHKRQISTSIPTSTT